MKSAEALRESNKDAIKEFIKFKIEPTSQRDMYNFTIYSGIWFADMMWDFNHTNIKNRALSNYRFDFNKIPGPFVLYVKSVIFHELNIGNNDKTSAHGVYSNLKTIINELYNDGINDVRLLTLQVVEEYINNKWRSRSPSYTLKLAIVLKKLFNIIQELDNYEIDDIVKALDDMIKKCSKNQPRKAINNCIPFAFLNQIVALAIKDIDNDSLKLDDRILACMLVILAETGMRAEEASLLETNKLDTIQVGEKKVGYLRFTTFKTDNNDGGGKETYTWLSEKALKAYTMCSYFANRVFEGLSERTKARIFIELHTKEKVKGKPSILLLREKIGNISREQLINLEEECRRYIFVSEKYGTQKKGPSVLRENIEKFFVRHGEDFYVNDINAQELSNIKKLKINSKEKYKKFFSTEQRKNISFEEISTKEYLYVNPHMFRVTVCTKLFLEGVHIDYIMKHMNHLEEEMSNYYYKDEDFIDHVKESIEIVDGMINEDGVLETNSDLLDNSIAKKALHDDFIRERIWEINKFIMERNNSGTLNIKRELGDILRKLEKTNTPIEENEFGVCIRSLLYGICDKRKYFSTISDNYFIGVHLPTYRYLHHTYYRFKQKMAGVEHNKKIAEIDCRYEVEYERERKALKYFVKKTLNDEILLLESDIVKRGTEIIVKEYPEIQEIICNINIIKEELEQWMD